MSWFSYIYQCLYKGIPAITVSKNARPIWEFRINIFPQLIPLQSAGISIWVLSLAYSFTISSNLVSILVIITSQSVLKIHSASGNLSIASLMTKILPQPDGWYVSGIGGSLAIIGFPPAAAPQ